MTYSWYTQAVVILQNGGLVKLRLPDSWAALQKKKKKNSLKVS